MKEQQSKEQEAAPEEDKEKFHANFKSMHQSALALVDAASSEELIKNAYAKIEQMKEYVSQHAYHLPTYEMHNCMEDIRMTEGKLQTRRDLAPKKHFQFSKRAPKAAVAVIEPEEKKEPAGEHSLGIALSESDISMKNLDGADIEEKKTEGYAKDNCYCYIGENVLISL